MTDSLHQTAPVLSVILMSRDTADSLSCTLAALRGQTVASAIEVVVVIPSRAEAGISADWSQGFHSGTVVEAGPFLSWAHAATAGARAAAAPVVVFGEDHCFPEPRWADALINAHTGDWVAVAPVFRNANPGSAVSWADFLIAYGPWMAPMPSASMPFIPGHNCSYKRSILLAYGDRLQHMLHFETVLHWELRSRGMEVYLASEAVVRHVNFSSWRSFLRASWHTGRLFAGSRAEPWSRTRRLLFTLASPLIPWVRLARIARTCLKREDVPILHAIPALLAGLTADAAGQALGYALGAGDSAQKLVEFEYRRDLHVRDADRKLFRCDDPMGVMGSER